MKSSNPIRGLGNDIIEIERMRQSIDRHGLHFLNRLFSQREQDYCYKFKDPVPHFAGRFAAKEAIVKALGTGFGAEVSWHDIEVLNDDLGKPIVYLKEPLQKRFDNPHLLVSISHSSTHATAVAIWS
ncbi:MAG TPA: holo-ACP synthase [Chlamydiales bacterium]|nr:holo-ACP synthase [Chlamydiales bacterium]